MVQSRIIAKEPIHSIICSLLQNLQRFVRGTARVQRILEIDNLALRLHCRLHCCVVYEWEMLRDDAY